MPHRTVLAALAAIVVTLTFATVAIAATGPPDLRLLKCETYDADEAVFDEMVRAGNTVLAHTFDRGTIKLLADEWAKQPGALVAGTAGTITIDTDKADRMMVIGYVGKSTVQLRFYLADGCMYANGEMPVRRYLDALQAGGFIE